jgi:hypothetical protein
MGLMDWVSEVGIIYGYKPTFDRYGDLELIKLGE